MTLDAERGARLKASPALSTEHIKELRASCAELVRRAILTLSALPDPDRRFQRSPGSGLPAPAFKAADILREFDHDVRLAISKGEGGRRARYFRPTPADISRCLEVWSWLAWLAVATNGKRDLQILIARAHGASWWKLSQRFNRGDDQLRRWQNGAIAAITCRYWRDIERLT